MLVICYGMAKSGSTLTYEVTKGILADAGHDQKKVRSFGLKPGGRGNYMADLSRDALLDIIEAIGSDRIVAAKTHMVFDAGMFAWLEDLQAQRKLQVIASYRDPRDICLSLVDHGKRSRNLGKEAFAHIGDLDRAAGLVEKAIPKFRKWASLQGSLRVYFDTVAFTPDDAIASIEKTLGVSADHDAVKQHAFEDAFTQKNKAQKSRFATEMNADEQAALESRFSEFIERVCRQNDPQWFSGYREQMLAAAR